MNVVVNGEPQTVDDGVTLAALLEGLDMRPNYVAVERNRQLVPRAQHADCVLCDGDQLEIVTLVGGG
ncbi:MAG: sulfur carrier protein ThiS [Planctomycetaceae bacterium]